MCSWLSGTNGINERIPEIEAKLHSTAVEVETVLLIMKLIVYSEVKFVEVTMALDGSN